MYTRLQLIRECWKEDKFKSDTVNLMYGTTHDKTLFDEKNHNDALNYAKNHNSELIEIRRADLCILSWWWKRRYEFSSGLNHLFGIISRIVKPIINAITIVSILIIISTVVLWLASSVMNITISDKVLNSMTVLSFLISIILFSFLIHDRFGRKNN